MVIDEEFKVVSEEWVVIVMMCQWRDICWVVSDESWLYQFWFSCFIKDFFEKLIIGLERFYINVNGFCDRNYEVMVLDVFFGQSLDLCVIWVVVFDCIKYVYMCVFIIKFNGMFIVRYGG